MPSVATEHLTEMGKSMVSNYSTGPDEGMC